MFRLEGKHLGDRAGLEARLGRAMETLWIAYQPIVSWSRQAAFAYEALVRNEEPTLRSPPDLFEAAERLGRLQELGRLVRDRVAHTLDETPTAGLLFVNLHALELDDDSLVSPDAPLSRHASRVVLEVTERAPLETHSRCHRARGAAPRARLPHRRRRSRGGLRRADQLRPPRARGGEGRHVADPRPRPLADEAEAARVDRGLCRDLGIEMIAEGIETEAERDALVRLGGDLCQGYLFARPEKPWARDHAGSADRSASPSRCRPGAC